MTLLEKYNSAKVNSLSVNERFVFKILDDISDRRGLRQAWDDIDSEVQNEILEGWVKILDDNK